MTRLEDATHTLERIRQDAEHRLASIAAMTGDDDYAHIDVARLTRALETLDGGSDGEYRWTFTMESVEDFAEAIVRAYADARP